MIPKQLELNKRYRITYQLTTQRRPREFVAVVLEHAITRWEDKIILSGRPAFGTSELPISTIIKMERTEAEPYQPRMA